MLFATVDIAWVVEKVITVLISAAGAGLPLYAAFRKAKNETREANAKLDIMITKEQQGIKQVDKINAEAEWSRLLEARKDEIKELKEKDSQQEKEIDQLRKDYQDCRESKIRDSERLLIALDKVKTLESTVLELKAMIFSRQRKSKAKTPSESTVNLDTPKPPAETQNSS